MQWAKQKVMGLWEGFRRGVGEVEREQLDHMEAQRGKLVDWQTVGVILFASLMLSVQEYFGSSSHYGTLITVAEWFGEGAGEWMKGVFKDKEYGRLARLWYWSLATSACYLLGPALYIKLVMKKRIRDYGFSTKGVVEHSGWYAAMFLVILPLLFAVGWTPGFQKTYPFYKQAGRSLFDFGMWEIAYMLQFMSLEFFFRGFMVHGLKKRFGLYAVLVAVMPYCMIHFGKPMPETLGSIVAGVALGTLSLMTRSVWLGVAIHISVAVSMDMIALWYRGVLG